MRCDSWNIFRDNSAVLGGKGWIGKEGLGNIALNCLYYALERSVMSGFQQSGSADLNEAALATPCTGCPPLLSWPFKTEHALHFFPIAEMAYSRSSCSLVGPISSRRCMIWMIAASRPDSTWKSDGGLISTRSNGRWWCSITKVMVKLTTFRMSGIVHPGLTS